MSKLQDGESSASDNLSRLDIPQWHDKSEGFSADPTHAEKARLNDSEYHSRPQLQSKVPCPPSIRGGSARLRGINDVLRLEMRRILEELSYVSKLGVWNGKRVLDRVFWE